MNGPEEYRCVCLKNWTGVNCERRKFLKEKQLKIEIYLKLS